MYYCEGGTLVHAHGKKNIHCDIKPENILLKITSTGYLTKLSDFGIARWTEEQLQSSQTEGYTGSPAYMTPERFYGKYSAASNIYAVGILLYELSLFHHSRQKTSKSHPKDRPDIEDNQTHSLD